MTLHRSDAMKRYVPLVLETIGGLALAIWLGGLAVMWLVLAPSAHSVAGASQPAALALFEETLRRFSVVIEACGIVIAAVQWVLRRRYARDKSRFVADGVRMVIVFIALFGAEYCRYVLLPTLLKTHSSGAYSTLMAMAVLQAVLLVGYATITGWLQLPGVGNSSAPVTATTVQPDPIRPTQSPNATKPTPARTSQRKR